MGFAFIALTVLFTVIGQILVKQGMLEVGAVPPQLPAWPSFIGRALTNPRVFFGFGCAFVAALCWIVAVSKSPLSIAYPFMGLGIALVLVLSGVVLGEEVPVKRWLGVLVVCGGLWLASQK
jgi:multidrug transporter EmrE-like cation transporter